MSNGRSKLKFMMSMDSGNWRGKGTEYSTQKEQGRAALRTSDTVRKTYESEDQSLPKMNVNSERSYQGDDPEEAVKKTYRKDD